MKIICVGRNYAAHAKEMNSVITEEPVVFMKPDTALLQKRQPFFIPDIESEIHHEAEIVIKINKVGKNIQQQFSHRYYDEVTIGIDFTARDLQAKFKSKGLPWELAKSFDQSAPVGDFIPVDEAGPVNSIKFHFNLNGKTVQTGNTADMLFNIDFIISYISHFFTLKKGDLIFTGTPEGVGPVHKGDLLEGFIGDKKLLNVQVR